MSNKEALADLALNQIADDLLMTYGGSGTIHQNGALDVEVAPDGTVVAIWFRCAQLPFNVSHVGKERAASMRSSQKQVDKLRIDSFKYALPPVSKKKKHK